MANYGESTPNNIGQTLVSSNLSNHSANLDTPTNTKASLNDFTKITVKEMNRVKGRALQLKIFP